MSKALISVIVPCYNQAQYLDECLQSVLNQTYPNWECIIVNDGSPDNTEEIAKNWTAKDSRFLYLKKENGGLSSARNAGIERAKGEWIQFLDCDDRIYQDKLIEVSNLNDNTAIIISQFDILKNGKIHPGYCHLKSEMFSFENILLFWGKQISIPIHCGLFKKSLFTHFQFDTSVNSMEDWLMWLHIFNQNPKVLLINQPLATYRKDDENSMSADLRKLALQKIEILPKIKQKYGEISHDRLVYHEIKNLSIDNMNLKKELTKIQNSTVVSLYLRILKKLYNIK